MQFTELSNDEKNTLRQTAKDSIQYGLEHNTPLPVEIENFSGSLQNEGASFVTLNLNGQLRGCIGTLEAHQPLIKDVSDHAFDAAFRDPRFNPVSTNEISQLDIHISILTPPEEMFFSSEDDLLSQIKPGVDGLIMQDGFQKGTFLPAVWEQLPDKKEFLKHLKLKAGLSSNHWSDSVRIFRYHALSI